ncbi:MAG: hypothetical protein ACE5IJ_00675 [Thermoplasmata archaeon]
MSSDEPGSPALSGKLAKRLRRGFSLVKGNRVWPLIVMVFALPLVLLSLIQYGRYGFELFLGWDTSTYVWWAQLVLERGALTMIVSEWSYPHLYVLLVVGLGTVLGDVALAERILPTLIAIPLGLAYYRLTTDITADYRYGLLAALLGAVAIHTIRLYADLHRNLLAQAVALAVGLYVFRAVTKEHPTERGRRWSLVLAVPLLAVVAFAHLETYLVLSLTLLVLFLARRNLRIMLVGPAVLAVPLIAMSPLLPGFVQGFVEGSAFFLPVNPNIGIADLLLFAGPFLPFIVIGGVELHRQFVSGNLAARFVGWWFLVLVGLLPLIIVLGLPPSRVLVSMPFAILLALSVGPIARWMPKFLTRFRRSRGEPQSPRHGETAPTPLAPVIAVLLVVTPTVLTAAVAADVYVQPYVKLEDITPLTASAVRVREMGHNQPIVVMYGPEAAYFSPIYRAYFGIQIPQNLVYYGKLQFLFTLPENPDVYVWRFVPTLEASIAAAFRAEVLAGLGDPLGALSRPIVLVPGASYDRALSESFLEPFRMPTGFYLIPADSLTPETIDRWRLFAHADWSTSTAFDERQAAWSESPTVLEWVAEPAESVFRVTYPISLAEDWSTMELVVRLWDWESPFLLPSGISAPLAPLEIYLDGVPIHLHEFGGSGVEAIRVPLMEVAPGIHQITLEARGTADLAIVVTLDTLELCPLTC